ncbi:DUF5131 family protein [Streptomyces sp. NPDC054802]
MTAIEWTDATWNPTTGCDRVSPGCDNCYALTMAKRLKGMGSAKYQRDGNPGTSGPGFGVAVHEDTLTEPLHWKNPRRVFVNSMSDLFHAQVPDAFIAEVFAVMARTPQHTYQVLTKRHGRMRSLLSRPTFRDNLAHLTTAWPLPNVWLGVSVEDQERADLRVPALLETPAAVRFLSCEPLLAPVDLEQAVIPMGGERGHGLTASYVHAGGCCRKLHGLDWVIVGGESGPGARPMRADWARSLRDQCGERSIPFFFKQAGAVLAQDWGCTDRKGHRPSEWPDRFPRQFPSDVQTDFRASIEAGFTESFADFCRRTDAANDPAGSPS